MAKRTKRPSAFKHGAYCRTDVLPGEDAATFQKLHDGLVAEFLPHGAVEENIVADLARLFWRKQNMATYRLAELARRQRSELNKMVSAQEAITIVASSRKKPADELLKIQEDFDEVLDDLGREKFGEAWDLMELGDVATVDYLLKELSVAERLDGMIDRALKRLLFVRGIKSFAQTKSEGPNSRSIEPPRPD